VTTIAMMKRVRLFPVLDQAAIPDQMTPNSKARNPRMRDPGPGLAGREGGTGTGGGSVDGSTADLDLLGCPASDESAETPIHGVASSWVALRSVSGRVTLRPWVGVHHPGVCSLSPPWMRRPGQ